MNGTRHIIINSLLAKIRGKLAIAGQFKLSLRQPLGADLPVDLSKNFSFSLNSFLNFPRRMNILWIYTQLPFREIPGQYLQLCLNLILFGPARPESNMQSLPSWFYPQIKTEKYEIGLPGPGF